MAWPTILFLDCQTTGIRPGQSHLLEIAWAFADGEVESRLVQLPEGTTIPRIVREMTGISPEMMVDAVSSDTIRDEFLRASAGGMGIAHYAQFEKSFLEQWLGPLPFSLHCSYKIARRLFPTSPSRSIRGMLGYLDLPSAEIRRAADHVRATRVIWRALEPRLAVEGVSSPEALVGWLGVTRKSTGRKIDYHLEKAKRLALPTGPGIYRMLSSTGKVLYVGKATSLRSRVNSYFRGVKGRDPKKLEMLAQVRDLEVTECGSALEAALLETDEIKRLNPPYNISLKTGSRGLIFFRRDFMRVEAKQSAEFSLGPFRPQSALDQLCGLVEAIRDGAHWCLYRDQIDPEVLAAADELLRELYGFTTPSVRLYLALGMKMVRLIRRESGSELAQQEEAVIEGEGETADSGEEIEVEDVPLTPEQVASRVLDLVHQAAVEYLRAKELTQLLDARVKFLDRGEWRTLDFSGGRRAERTGARAVPWEGLNISDYDRMSVLRTELGKMEFEIHRREI